VLTEPREIAFLRWVGTLPQESLPDLERMMRALAERRPAKKAHAAVLKFLLSAGYPDASDKAAKMVRAGWQVVGER
jgi:hypothetical protein